jgi:DNA-binding transcriptional ArsR family regulator
MKIKELTPENLQTAAEMLKAMAHPVRVSILSLLDGGKKLTVTEIHETLHLEQSVASHHLGILKNKNVLGSHRNGKNTYYFLKNDNLSSIVDCISRCSM